MSGKTNITDWWFLVNKFSLWTRPNHSIDSLQVNWSFHIKFGFGLRYILKDLFAPFNCFHGCFGSFTFIGSQAKCFIMVCSFCRLVCLRVHPMFNILHPTETFVSFVSIDGSKHEVGHEVGEQFYEGDLRPNGNVTSICLYNHRHQQQQEKKKNKERIKEIQTFKSKVALFGLLPCF